MPFTNPIAPHCHGIEFTGQDVLDIGHEVLRLEKEFNVLAGFTEADDELPEFFKDPTGLPEGVELENYTEAWSLASFPSYMFNSVIYTVVATTMFVIMSVFVAFPIARGYVKGSGALRIGEELYLQGSVFYETGPTERVDIATGVPANLGDLFGAAGGEGGAGGMIPDAAPDMEVIPDAELDAGPVDCR